MVAETLPAPRRWRATWWLRVTLQLALEAVALPFRFIFRVLTA
jgi:hypothetical protein